MWKFFYPDRIARSADKIDYSKEYANGVRGIVFDIDNTLVPHAAPAIEATTLFFNWLRDIGMKTCLISNNDSERVKPFAEKVGSFYMPKAGKPDRKGYLKAMELMGTTLEDTIFVGDQILTDVYGAKRTGMRSILVRPVKPETDPLQIRMKRVFERMVLNEYKEYLLRRNILLICSDEELKSSVARELSSKLGRTAIGTAFEAKKDQKSEDRKELENQETQLLSKLEGREELVIFPGKSDCGIEGRWALLRKLGYLAYLKVDGDPEEVELECSRLSDIVIRSKDRSAADIAEEIIKNRVDMELFK